MVQWIGEDSTSGLAAYDVQVRVDGGAWQDWRVGVTGTSGVYVGILGHTYAFRSRGHDRAGNVEGWPAVPDAETRVVARVRKTYIFGGMPVAVRLLAEGETAGLLVYLHLDHLGSPVVATDGGGDVVAEVRYYPYGGMRYQMGEMPTTLNFTGQRLDAGVGLLYYRARYYDPMLGRFVQPDTVVPEPGDPQSLNRFAYVRNNPLRFTDQTGHYITEGYDTEFEENCLQTKFYGPGEARRVWGISEPQRASYTTAATSSSDDRVAEKIWSWQVTMTLWEKGGPASREAARYLLEGHEVVFRDLPEGAGGTVDFLTGDVVLAGSPQAYNPKDPKIAAKVAHETKHGRQGLLLAFSTLGELEAFQYESEVYREMTGKSLGSPWNKLSDLPSSCDPATLAKAKGYMAEFPDYPPGHAWWWPLLPAWGFGPVYVFYCPR